jgi:hypothetical protein
MNAIPNQPQAYNLALNNLKLTLTLTLMQKWNW